MTTAPKTNDYDNLKAIFVNNLDKKTSESELYKKISDENPQISNVMIRKDDQYETAIAYINMNTHEAAKDVIAKFNGKKIGNYNIRMSFAMTSPAKLTQNDTNLYVKNIKREVSQNDFQAIFEVYGEISSCKLSMNEKGESNGFGYVKFFELSSAEAALADKEKIAAAIGAEQFDICKYDKPRRSENTNLYVGNIHETITKEDFIKYFETFGPIRKNGETPLVAFFKVDHLGKNKGFVNFENAQDAVKALTSPKLNVLGEGELVIAYYKTRMERRKEYKMKDNEIKKMISTEYKDFNLYVKSNKETITIDEVKEAFERCGEIYSVKIRYSIEKKQPDGIFYICMKNKEDKESVKAKCAELNWDAHDFKPRTTFAPKFPQHMMPMQMPFQGYGMAPMNYAAQPFLMNILNFMNMQGGMGGFGPYHNGPYPGPQRTTKNPMGGKQGSQKGQRQRPGRKPQNPPEEPVQKHTKEPAPAPAPVQAPIEEVITEDMKNDLGDSLYDFIESTHNFDEELTGRITGVLLESIEYGDLRAKMDNPNKTELNQIIIEIKTNLERMEQ